MAAEAAGSKLSVRRFAFLGVTAGALCLFARARVRLMAADAGLVSERGRGRLTLAQQRVTCEIDSFVLT